MALCNGSGEAKKVQSEPMSAQTWNTQLWLDVLAERFDPAAMLQRASLISLKKHKADRHR